MLKYSLVPKFGYRLLVVTKDEEPFAKVYAFSRSPAWYVSLRGRKPRRFMAKRKLLNLNDALKWVDSRDP